MHIWNYRKEIMEKLGLAQNDLSIAQYEVNRLNNLLEKATKASEFAINSQVGEALGEHYEKLVSYGLEQEIDQVMRQWDDFNQDGDISQKPSREDTRRRVLLVRKMNGFGVDLDV